MRYHQRLIRNVKILTLVLSCGLGLRAQDTRTVTEPSFPTTICATLAAQLTVTAGEPSSETAFDTTRVQNALNSCPVGQALELTASGSYSGFLMQPFSIPAGVTLLIDGGVTVFSSLNPADYQQGTVSSTQDQCGTDGYNGNGCVAWLRINKNSASSTGGAAIMGYGVIDGRGADALVDSTGKPRTNPYTTAQCPVFSWWCLGAQSYLTTPASSQNNPVMIEAVAQPNFTLYKITVRNAPLFNIRVEGDQTLYGPQVSGLTIWDIKINEPYTARNTDGIDPVDNLTNVTITNSYISNGDDMVAVSSNAPGKPVTNITVSNVYTYSGRGISIGSGTSGGVSNMLVTNLNQYGNLNDTSGNGFRIKSDGDRGGLVQNITYNGVCQQNEYYAIRLDSHYQNETAMTEIPSYQNITMENVTILNTGYAGTLWFRGYDANHIATVTLNNVNVSSTDVVTPSPQYTAFTVGPGPFAPSSVLAKLTTGTGVTSSSNVTNPTATPYACSSANFPMLIGELYLSTGVAGSFPTGSGTNLRTLPAAAYSSTSAFTLNAMIEPAAAEFAALTNPITFYDGSAAIGTGAIGVNGTLAMLTVTGASAGTHTYTAQYPADSNYAAFGFGSISLTVTAASTTTTLSTVTSPVVVNVAQTLKATVASAGGIPTGSVTFLSNGVSIGTGTLSGGVATLSYSFATAGSYAITASYAAQGNYGASATVSGQIVTVTLPSTFTLAASATTPASINPGSSATSTVTVTPQGGFTGTVTVACTSPVSYVTCQMSGAATITGTSAASVTATIAVSQYAALHQPSIGLRDSLIALALLLPLGLGLPLYRKRRSLLAAALLAVIAVGVSACGSGSSSSSGGGSTGTPPPAGSQTLTITGASGSLTATTTLSVNVN